MAKDASFDVTTGVDLQEVDNAINQAQKELGQRYDFKGSKSKIEWDAKKKEISLPEARKIFKDQPFKLELINDLEKEGLAVLQKEMIKTVESF